MKPLEKSLKRIKEYKKLNIALELAKHGEPIVTEHYGKAEAQNEDFVTLVEETSNGAILTVMGEDVMFREFGAGVNTAVDYPLQDTEGLPPIRPGSWSEEHAQQFSEKGHWWYDGKSYQGIYPTKGMYYAALSMREHMGELAKEKLR